MSEEVYLGAYKKALELGLVISETAGTSAGSIFAALIAAGATPEQIGKLITPEELNRLAIPLAEYDNSNEDGYKDGRWYRFFCLGYWRRMVSLWKVRFFKSVKRLLLKSVCRGLVSHFKIRGPFERLLHNLSLGFFSNYGIFDSNQLRNVVADWLYKVTGIHNVTFKELDKNLWIVATDVENKSYQLWSTKYTPSASVADAVAASCCVPFYYTPFDRRYIDGGLLSNRPDFVFSHLPENYNILSFRTKSDASGNSSFLGYLNDIVSSLLEGADILQHKTIRDVKTVTIDVGNFNGLDFWDITERDIHKLIKYGEEAMSHFYEMNMILPDDNVQWDAAESTDILESMDQVISVVSLWSMTEYDEVWVSDLNLDWVWPLFPTLLKWCKSNVTVRVFCGIQSSISEKEQAIRRQLHYIGIEVEDLEPASMQRGFFFQGANGCKAVCYTDIKGCFKGKIYSTEVDNDIIKAEIYRISQQPVPNWRVYMPILEKADYNKLFELLRSNVVFYNDATFTLEKLNISQLYFMSRFVRGDKYVQIGSIYSLYKDAGLENMFPAQIAMLDGKKSIVTPIIVEEHDGKLVVIKGNVRLLFAYKANPKITEIWGVVVRNVDAKLPSQIRIPVERLYLSESKKDPKERYGEDFDASLIRTIDQALRPNGSYLK